MAGAYEVVTTAGFGSPAGSDGVVVTTPSFTWDLWTPPPTSSSVYDTALYDTATYG